MKPGCELSEGNGQNGKLRHRERAFSQSELGWNLRGLQNPSELYTTPGPHQPPAWGVGVGLGEEEEGSRRIVGTWKSVVGILCQLCRPAMNSPSSVRPL